MDETWPLPIKLYISTLVFRARANKVGKLVWWLKSEVTFLFDEYGTIIWPNECTTQFWAGWPEGEGGWRRATAPGLGGDLFRMREARRRASDGSQRASRASILFAAAPPRRSKSPLSRRTTNECHGLKHASVALGCSHSLK